MRIDVGYDGVARRDIAKGEVFTVALVDRAPGKSDHIDPDAHTHGPGNSLLKSVAGQSSDAAPGNPDPGAFQVWLPPAAIRWTEADGTLTLDRILPGEEGGLSRILWTNGAGCAASMVTAPANGWRCIGVATPYGRVMVGDGFALPDGHRVSIIEVAHHGVVECAHSGGGPSRLDADQLTREATRTRYAPARAGERFRDRETGQVIRCVDSARDPSLPGEAWAFIVGAQPNPEKWERLDPALSPGVSTAKQEGGVLAQAPLDHAHVRSQGGYDGLIILPVLARTGLHWELGASPVGLRSLDDAIGRALEIGYAEETIDQAGLFRLTLDELLISPTVVFAEGVNIAADTKHLRALRVTVKEAAAGGCCTCSSWGKEQSITVRRLEPANVEVKAP